MSIQKCILASMAALGLVIGLAAEQDPVFFEAFPGIEWVDVGDDWYRSAEFGDVKNNDNPKRFFSKSLGWLTVVSLEEETGKYTFKTDDHSFLWTVPEWLDPQVGRNYQSTVNNTVFMSVFDPDQWPGKFLNRSTEQWQDSVFHPLWDYVSYHQDAFNFTVATQTIVGQLQELQVLHAGVTDAEGSKEILDQMNGVFENLQFHYDTFIFFYWRTINAYFFARTDAEREASIAQHNAAEHLVEVANAAFQIGQEALQQVKSRHEQLGGGGGVEPVPGGGQNAGAEWENPIIVGPVAQDVMSWPKSITLQDVYFGPSPVGGRISIHFPSTKPSAWRTVNLNPGGRANYTVGNFWLIQKIGDKFYATTMDYFRPNQFRNDWAPHVFWEHLSGGGPAGAKSDKSVAPMVYRKGETYGLMVTTPARRSNRTTNERSNIVLFKMQ